MGSESKTRIVIASPSGTRSFSTRNNRKRPGRRLRKRRRSGNSPLTREVKISAGIGLIVAILAIIVSFVYAYYRAKQDEAELREQRIELSAYIEESLAKDGYSKDGQSAWQIADDWSSDYYGGKPVVDLKSTTQHLDLAAKTKSMAGMPTPEMVEAGWRPEYSIESVQIVQAGDAPGGLILMAGKRPDGGKTVIAYKVDLKENGG